MTALIALFISNLPALLSAGESLAGFVEGVYSSLSQTADWTPEVEAAYQAALQQYAASKEWKSDPATPPAS
jgi:hypothetical protein